MDTITIISDVMDSQNLESNFLDSIFQMAQEYEYQLMIQELNS